MSDLPALVRCAGRLDGSRRQCNEMIEPHRDLCVWCEDLSPERSQRSIPIETEPASS